METLVTFTGVFTYKRYNQLKPTTMGMFKVVWEIELEADSPLDAAKTSLDWIREDNSTGSAPHQFYVQQDNTKEVYSVDLLEEDEDAVLLCKDGYTPIIES